MEKVPPCFLVLSLITINAAAAGFDERYTVHEGDFKSDGKVDLYVKPPSAIVIPVGEIPIVLPPPVRAFVLENDGQGSFNIVAELIASERSSMAQWPVANVDTWFRDADVDGRNDLELISVSSAVVGASDVIVFAGTKAGSAPLHITSADTKFNKYHGDLMQWMINPNHFEDAAPLSVTGAEPPSRSWFRTVPNSGDLQAINRSLTVCEATYPSNTCAVTSVDPSPCVQVVGLLDENDQLVGTDTVDLCQYNTHIFVYVLGSVTTAKDYSVFDQDARESADILERLNAVCPALPQGDAAAIQGILEEIYGQTIFDGRLVVNQDNSFQHDPFPGDVFNPNDKTYHHYDVVTQVCASHANCTLAIVRDQVGRRFTYPSRQLEPHLTAVDGQELLTAYISLDTADPSAYVIQAGKITQEFVLAIPWANATQNITEFNHIVYPGVISRYIDNDGTGDGVEVFTHGVGINRAFCTLLPAFRPTNMLLAWANDKFGPKAFKQLDREMIKYWDRNYGSGGQPVELPCIDLNESGCTLGESQ